MELLSPILVDIALVIIGASILSYFFRILKQPLIPAYILAGVLLGPMGFNMVKDTEIISTLSQLGIAFLLFLVGMEISISRLKNLSSFMLYGGFLQLILTGTIFFFLISSLGSDRALAMSLAIIVCFSSTAIVLKILSDKNALNTIHGRLTVAILLFQDLAAVMVLSLVAITPTGSTSLPVVLFNVIINSAGLIMLALIIRRFVVPPLLSRILDAPEVLFLFALTGCFSFMGLAALANIPMAVGAFVGGLALSAYPYELEIVGRLSPLRDFFMTIFFVTLGMQLSPGDTLANPVLFLALFLGVVILKPFIVFILTRGWGYGFRVAFLSSINHTQISEFSLVLAFSMLEKGVISQQIMGLVTALFIATMLVSSYVIRYGDLLFDRVFVKMSGRGILESLFSHKVIGHIPEHIKKAEKPHAVLAGHDVIGATIRELLERVGYSVVVIDYDPDKVEHLMALGVPVVYGDVRHPEVLEKVHLQNAEILVSTVPSLDDNMFLLTEARKKNPNIVVVISCPTIEDAIVAYRRGADFVLVPEYFGKEKVIEELSNIFMGPGSIRKNIEQEKKAYILRFDREIEKSILEENKPEILFQLEKELGIDKELHPLLETEEIGQNPSGQGPGEEQGDTRGETSKPLGTDTKKQEEPQTPARDSQFKGFVLRDNKDRG